MSKNVLTELKKDRIQDFVTEKKTFILHNSLLIWNLYSNHDMYNETKLTLHFINNSQMVHQMEIKPIKFGLP